MKYELFESADITPEQRGRLFKVYLDEGETQQDLLDAVAEAVALGTCGECVIQQPYRFEGRWMLKTEYGEFAVAVHGKGREASVVVAKCDGNPGALLEATQLFMGGVIERQTITLDTFEEDANGEPLPGVGYTIHVTPLPVRIVPPPIPVEAG